MQGAAIVLRTLVPNARRIFQILAEQQMQDPENGKIGASDSACWQALQQLVARYGFCVSHLDLLCRTQLSSPVQDMQGEVSCEQ